MCKRSASQSKAIEAFFKDKMNLFVIGGHSAIYMINVEDTMTLIMYMVKCPPITNKFTLSVVAVVVVVVVVVVVE